MELQESGTSIDFVLTEDQDNWYFNITSDKINNLNSSKFYLIKKLIITMNGIEVNKNENKLILSLKKV